MYVYVLPVYLILGIGVDTEVTNTTYPLACVSVLHIFLSFFSLSLLVLSLAFLD